MFQEFAKGERIWKPRYGLTLLILTSDIVFKERHILKILQLEQSNQLHQQIYQRLTSLIDDIVASVYKEHRLSTLNSYPLTEIVAISYFVADKFPWLFYNYDKLDTSKSESALLRAKEVAEEAYLLKVPRYNQVWIITYLLKEAYNKHVE
ncbi:hypothetical protein CANMA_004339 [Candida margitis]|uniref:uncharacterized protein n=1 Tax=Candida margitis TaxID=1775924 RepID=UPI0022277656|nr:uncharacterized protein CANMA_004339 [Candida margitis]KAI5957907.1 hypothetical protein CANMA_004339 [Candida margitis]